MDADYSSGVHHLSSFQDMFLKPMQGYTKAFASYSSCYQYNQLTHSPLSFLLKVDKR